MAKESNPRPVAGALPVPKMRRGLKGFFKDVRREMKHVTWPTRKETVRLTGVVLSVCFLIIIFLFLLSTVFDTLLTILLRSN